MTRNWPFSAVTIHDLAYGVERAKAVGHPASDALEAGAIAIEAAFLGRILPIDSEAAKIWAGLLAQKHKHVNDRALVAIARTHGLILVSGNVKDLVGLGVDVLDPFKRPARLHPAGGVR
jgi:predicted nucleic acid-binding protein